MAISLKRHPSTRPAERATGSYPDLLRVTPIGTAVPNKSGPRALASGGMRSHPGSLGRAREEYFPFSDETVAVEARSFAREHAWLGGIDFGYDHPFDELIYPPAAE